MRSSYLDDMRNNRNRPAYNAYIQLFVFLYLFTLIGGDRIKNKDEKREKEAQKEFLLGNAFYEKKNYENAILKYKTSIQLNPENPFYYTNLGNCLRESGNFRDSVQVLQKSIFLSDRNPKSWYSLGVMYQTMGSYGEAIYAYQNATALDPMYVNAHYNMGLSYQDNGDLNEAIKCYEIISKITPTHTESKLNHCNILFVINKNNNLPLIEQCYLDILMVDSGYIRAIVNVGAFYHSTNKELQAIQYYEKALILDPKNSMAKHGLLSLKTSEKYGRYGISNKNKAKKYEKSEINVNGEIGNGGNKIDEENIGQEVIGEMGDIGEIKNGLDENYVFELFDSYSFHFEESLKGLDYQSHLLVGGAVGRYYDSGDNDGNDENGGSYGNIKGNTNDGDESEGHNPTTTNKDTDNVQTHHTDNTHPTTPMYSDITILGVDLGSGTGLACTPIKQAITGNIRRQFERERMKKMNGKEEMRGMEGGGDTIDDGNNYNNNNGGDDNNNNNNNKNNKNNNDPFRPPFIGLLGVDLSPKMLEKSKQKNCYGDTVVGDVALFVRDYAANVQESKGIEKETAEGKEMRAEIGEGSETENEYPLLDFITAADVFMYLGDLQAILSSCFEILRDGGILVFTVEALVGESHGDNGDNNLSESNSNSDNGGSGDNDKSDSSNSNSDDGDDSHCHIDSWIQNIGKNMRKRRDESNIDNNNDSNHNSKKDGNKILDNVIPYKLQSSGRIAHNYQYIKDTSLLSGFTILEISRQIPRTDRGIPVKGYIIVLKKMKDEGK